MTNAPLCKSGAPMTNDRLEEHRFHTSPSRCLAIKIAYGPWSPTCHVTERRPQLRSLQAIIACFHGSSHPLIPVLRAAETDPLAFVEAQHAIETLPALHLRRVLSVFGSVTWPSRRGAP